MIKALLFDLDDTIIWDEPVAHRAFAEAASLASTLPGVDTGRLATAAGEVARRLWADFNESPYCVRIGHSAWEGLWAPYEVTPHPSLEALRDWAPSYRVASWREALAEQQVVDDALAAAMAAKFIEARRSYPRCADFDSLVAALGDRYLLGIVTNGVPDLQRLKIDNCGALHLFQGAVISGEIDCGKPDPGIFRHICAALGVQMDECVMIGDNPERDVAGAIASGMRSVWIRRGGRPRDERYPADLECEDLMAVLPWLEQVKAE